MHKNRYIGVSLVAVCVSIASTAQAQDAEPSSATAQEKSVSDQEPVNIGEVIVTARKRSERLLDVPDTIQAVTSEGIQAAGIANINDLGRISPGTVLNRAPDSESNVVIRGVGAFGTTQGVGFYVDDVQNFTDQSPNMNDVARVEILKGPQGTLYGGTNIGGAVKYVMKAPTDSLTAEGKIEAGGYETFNFFGAVSGPIDGAGNLKARVSAYHNRYGGFVYNPLQDENNDESRETGVRIRLDWTPSDTLSFQLSYRHSQLDNGGNEWIRKDNARDFSTINPLNVSIFNDRQVDGVILQGDYRPGSVALTSVSSYTRRDVKFLWDADFSSAEGLLATEGSRRVGNVYTQELRLASDNDSRFDWLVGAYFADVENRLITNSADVFIGPDSPIYPFVNPEGTGEYFRVPDFNNADVLERQYAGFVSVNYRFGDFRIGGGARINRSEYTGRRLNEDLRLVNNETRLLPKLTMSYDFGDSMAYANISRGAEPGKANMTGDLTDLYSAEIITQYEVGIKGQSADRRFIYEVAAFYLQSKDRQQELVLTDSTGTAVPRITNAGDSRSYGIEGSVTWRPITGLTLSLGGGWLNAKWRNGIVTSADLLDPEVLVDTPLRGKDVPVSPKFTGNASIDWRMPAGDGIEAGARADLARQGSLYWDLRNLSYQKAYNVVNLSLFAASMDNRWNLTFRVENLFQQRYFNVFNLGFDGEPDANGNCDMCSVGTLGSPRRALASLAFNL